MNRLNRMMALNKSSPRKYGVEAKDDASKIYLYDVIGYDFWSGGGVTAKQFAKDIAGIQSKQLHLHINSPGGDVFEARAIVSAMQQFKGEIVIHIDGLAASAASFIAMHGHKVEITDGAFFMIHNGWTMAIGDRHSMLDTAALLEQVDGSIVDDYHAKTGLEKDKLAAMMDAETWINAKDAVSMGFADQIAEPAKDSKAKAQTWNLAVYDNVPQEIAAQEIKPEFDEAEHTHRLRKLALLEPCPA